MLYQDKTEANIGLVNALYHCRNNPESVEEFLPKINAIATVKYLDHDTFPRELFSMFGLADPGSAIDAYLSELLEDQALERRYASAVERGIVVGSEHKPIRSFREKILIDHHRRNVSVFLYAFLRQSRPDVVVETGTCSGSFSSIIVTALKRNGRGKLISIDLPPSHGMMPTIEGLRDEDVGFLIPPEYRDHWDLRVGDAKVLLPAVMMENDVDVFFHDSLHTRTHMAFELAVARTFMREGTMIFSDDTLFNHAFNKFIETHHLPALACVNNPQVAFCVNRFDDFEREIGLETVRHGGSPRLGDASRSA